MFWIMFGMILVPVVIYIYFYLKRILSLYVDIKKYKIVLWVISAIIVLPSLRTLSVYTLTLLHFVVISLVIDMFHSLFLKNKNIFEKVYRFGVIPMICTALLLGYGSYHIHQLQRTDYVIYTEKNLSRSYRIAYISDLHYPNALNEEKLKAYCQKIVAEKPDMIILGGDIVDEQTTLEQMQSVFHILGQMNCPYGIYYVYGNHDEAIYSFSPYFTPKELSQTIQEANIHILSDSILSLNDELILIGRMDRSANRKRLSSAELIQSVDSQDFLLLLDHQPVDLKVNNDLGFDLQLSGHTHGGQIFPLGYLIEIFGEMCYGYKDLGHMQVVTSSGIVGWGFPIRTQGISEYVIVDISCVKK